MDRNRTIAHVGSDRPTYPNEGMQVHFITITYSKFSFAQSKHLYEKFYLKNSYITVILMKAPSPRKRKYILQRQYFSSIKKYWEISFSDNSTKQLLKSSLNYDVS